MEFLTILYQISFLTIIALIGLIAFKVKVLTIQAKEVLEKVVFNITTPLLIITRISSLEVNTGILMNGVFVIVFAYVIIFIQILAGGTSSRLLKMPRRQAVIHQLHTYMGNIVFLGFPLIDEVFPGGEALLYAALYQLVSNTVMWTHGVMKLDPSPGGTVFGNLRKLINPNTIALAISLIMLLFHLRLPVFLQDSLGGLGSTTLYLAMIYIGILLGQSRILLAFKKLDVIILSISKMLLIPFVMTVVVGLILSRFPLIMNKYAFSVLILQSSMPCMTILVILARRYKADDIKAMENFVVSTLLSIVSLPLIIYLLDYMVNIIGL